MDWPKARGLSGEAENTLSQRRIYPFWFRGDERGGGFVLSAVLSGASEKPTHFEKTILLEYGYE
jgi:hypothetical protein